MTPLARLLEATAAAATASGDPTTIAGVAFEAARHGSPDLARKLLAPIERAQEESWWYAALASVHGALGEAAAVTRLRKRAEKRWADDGAAPDATEYDRLQLAIAYEYLGKPKETDALLAGMQDGNGVAMLARVAAAAGRLDRAESLAGRDVITEDPGLQADVAVAIASAADRTGDRARGLAWLDGAVASAQRLEAPERRGLALATLSLVYAELGAKDKALETARLARGAVVKVKDPYGEPWHLVLAKALRAAGDAKSGAAIFDAWEAFHAQGPSPFGYAAAAAALARAGELERARSRMAEAEDRRRRAKDPGVAQADFARAYLALGEIDRAIDEAATLSDPVDRVGLLLELVGLAASAGAPGAP
jgi:hypothetical protein